ncbi:hypothetical protein BYT27DRAFT_7162823 [Phlegmacium glaucopus]|nr:hypothetical protein BYT27DRAFT_7162823 [Phlegmacium glaucopus]
MSARRVAVDAKSEEPANPTYIDFPRGDGQPSTWPTNTTRIVDSEGQVNFFDPLPVSHSQAIRWRIAVASAIANDLQMAEGPSYILRDFPVGYGFFDHNKGNEVDPRHDLYLYGPVKKRFRSVNEFIPHAIWLMKDPAIHNCACKYCSKNKSQREITASMSSILRSSPMTASPTPNRTKGVRDKRTRDPVMRLKEPRLREKVYAAVQKTVKPLKASANVLKHAMLVERNNDLRAIHSKTSMALRRWFREGEVVWCALPHAIVAPVPEKIEIQFWPAVIEEVLLKTKAVPRANSLELSTTASLAHGPPMASSSAVQLDNMDEEDGRGIVLESNDDPLHYTINQWTKYKVRFLAVSHSCSIDDVDVLPYQAHMPPDELIAFMTQIPPNELHFEKEIFTLFNPCPGDHAPSFSDAASPYAMALQIASTLSSFWCLTDEFEMKYTLQARPPTLQPSRPLPAPVPVHSSLQSAIEAAGRHNAQLSNNSMMSNSTFYQNVSSTTPHMSQAELQKTSTQILGIPSQSENLSQTRFQGLWWGTERIWVDDFIRLKVPRRSIAPEGAANILPPAGAGKRRLEQCLSDKRDPAEFTAGTRGVFMRLDGLYAVEVPRDDSSSGTTKAVRACGMLYEIVEEDWEDLKDSKSPEALSDNLADQSQQTVGPSQAGPSSSTAPAPSNATQRPQLDGAAPSTEVQPVLTTTLSSPNPGPVQSNLLPAAPVGYKLRPILEPECELVVELGLISGRYYPRILSHPQVVPAVRTAFSRSVEEGGVSSANNLWALEGLSGGYHNSVDPHKYKRSRVSMLQDADKESLIQLQAYKRDKLEAMNYEDDPMEIDEMYA